MENKILSYEEIKRMKVSRFTAKLPFYYLLLILTCFACKKSEEAPKICMTNKSGHPVHFWASGYGGHLENFGKNLCGLEVEPGNFYWRADYPTIDPSGQRTGHLMTWEGGFNVAEEDINFEFTDQSGTLIYDFRDSKVGNYIFDCKLINASQNNVIWTDTLPGTISKNSFLNQLVIEIDTFYSGIAVFDAYPQIYKFSDGQTGAIGPVGQDEIEIQTTYSTPDNLVRKICRGKKI